VPFGFKYRSVVSQACVGLIGNTVSTAAQHFAAEEKLRAIATSCIHSRSKSLLKPENENVNLPDKKVTKA